MMRRFFLGLTIILACTMAAISSQASDPVEHRDAEHVVHLLDYVAADYGMALGVNGQPNERELAEQIEVLAEAARHAARLSDVPGAPPRLAAEGVEKIKHAVEVRRPAAVVEESAKALRMQLTALYDLVEVPAATPTEARGAELYELHCRGCHVAGPAAGGRHHPGFRGL